MRFLLLFRRFTMEDKDDFLQNEEILDAVARFEEMMKKHTSTYFDVAELEGIIDYYLESSDLNSALQASKLAERLHPANANIQIKKAIILMDHEKFSEARKILDSLTRFESMQDEFDLAYIKLHLYLEDFTLASRLNEEICKRADDNKTDMLIDLAALFYQFFQFKESEKLLRLAYSFDNDDADTLLKLSEHVIRTNNIEGAIDLYLEYLDRNPFSEMIWFNLGNCYAVQDQIDQAISAYDFAIAIDEQFSPVYNAKGNAFYQADKFDEALACFREFLLFDDDRSQGYFQIGLCYERLSNFDEAMINFQLAIHEQPDFAEPYFMMSTVEYQLENTDKAMEFINKAISFDPINSEYLFLLGKIYLKSEDFEKAAEAFLKAVTEDVTDTESWFNLSYCLIMQEKTEKAIVELNKALEINVDDADLLYHLAATWFHIGNGSTAMKHFAQAYYLNPEQLEDLFEYYPELAENQLIKDFIAEEGI